MNERRYYAVVLCMLACTVRPDLASSLEFNANDEVSFRNTAAASSKQAIEYQEGINVGRGGSNGNDVAGNDTIVVFTPPQRIDVEEGEDVVLQVTFATSANRSITVTSADTKVATVDVFKVYLYAENNGTGFNVTVHGVFLSYTKLLFKACLLVGDRETNCTEHSYLVAVARVPSALRKSFPFLIGAIVAVSFINMGCEIDLELVRDTLKEPFPPLLGCIFKFVFMPIVSYGIGLLLLENALLRFGIFGLGCSPGGTPSNIWTHIFGGDVPLSVTMTVIDTIASIGTMPLWVFMLGRHMSPGTAVLGNLYCNIIASLVCLPVLSAIGIAIQRFKREWALAVTKCIKIITVIVLIAIITLSVTVNKYMFLLMTWQAVLAGALIPWSAYVFGAVAAFVGRLSQPQIIAVAIGNAFQNTGIAIVILYASFPPPDADIVIVPVVCQAIMQGVPLYLLYSGTWIKTCISKRLHPVEKIASESSSEP